MEIVKVETNFKRNLFWDVHRLKFNGKLKNMERGLINLYPDVKGQEIVGFGGAFTEASGYCLAQTNGEQGAKIIADYFSRDGLQYNFCRIPIASTDFSLSSYSYLKKADMNTFSIARDEEYIIPMIKKRLLKIQI